MTPPLRVKRLPHALGLDLPAYRTAGSAGLDLCAAVPDGTVLVIEPGARQRVPTGFAFELAEGFEVQVRPRSGLADRFGVTVLNAPGTVDADYRGEVQVLLVNLGREPFAIRRGDRIAQAVLARIERASLVEADALADTARGEGGFGSTGFAAASGSAG